MHKVYATRDILAQENKRIRVRFLRVPCWLGCVRPHIRFRSALASLVRSLHATSFVRQPSLPTTGSRPSDTPRVVINIDRASRDLAYFFYHLPVDRISWAFPYVPPGLYTQFCLFVCLFEAFRLLTYMFNHHATGIFLVFVDPQPPF